MKRIVISNSVLNINYGGGMKCGRHINAACFNLESIDIPNNVYNKTVDGCVFIYAKVEKKQSQNT